MHPSGRRPFNSLRAAGKPERLLRASVTAFCSIPRPTRREIGQLDDLAVPLLGRVSDETLRFVAAALSENHNAPPVLVRRLCERPVDISAPLLARSPLLTAIDLVALIGRHGLPHARVIASRRDLDGRIVRLIASIGALDDAATVQPAPADAPTPKPGVEETRQRLRTMMKPSGAAAQVALRGEAVQLRWEGEPGSYRKLRSTALSGVPALFHTALADELGVPLPLARDIADSLDPSRLIVSLRAIALIEEEAFLVFQCAWSGQSGHARMTAAFIDAYQTITPETARQMVATWRDAYRAQDDTSPAPIPMAYGEPANAPVGVRALKAS
ncbi:hypothetical protein [Mesorhizobium sp. CAU 1732]|uniref:hypothetical protein n=1 Tax=Mesorhizobium sp. CAU 1732 TaxID=3140358 RepID=UPI0032619F79